MTIDEYMVYLSDVLSFFSLDDAWTGFAMRIGAAQPVRTEVRELVLVHAKLLRTADVVCVVRSRESVCELRCELLLAPRTLWGDADFLIAVAGPRRLRAAQNAPLPALPALPARLAPHAHTHMHRLQRERCVNGCV